MTIAIGVNIMSIKEFACGCFILFVFVFLVFTICVIAKLADIETAIYAIKYAIK